ncbi:LOW QUALITY PROTEIN: disks large homolog 5-like [Paramacrobiotus metropolitanus]|uniref:LOW QUALITY PROTEIN: disks large homolog 5-like n=1 Tax=Paramacrobiotus metropolitanus TaxID=2943436 RepID=UPI0024464474|nr:LOW QUALITY PROTEIN: disks large homolog 5-like [Paramacrobiotus metropolitanus]
MMNNERIIKPTGKSPPTEFELRESSLSLLRSELNLVIQERDTLRLQLEQLRMSRPPDQDDLHALSPRLDRLSLPAEYEYKAMKTQLERALSEVQNLKKKIAENAKEVEYFRSKHRTALQEIHQLNNEKFDLRSRLSAVVIEKQQLELEVSDVQHNRDVEHEELMEMRRLYHENRDMYDPDGRISNLMVTERENLRERYESLANKYSQSLEAHATTMKQLESSEKENSRLKRVSEEATSEKNDALIERNTLKHQLNSLMKKRDAAVTERDLSHRREGELIMQINDLESGRINHDKELRRLTEERNSVLQEYTQIMSERATVHQEMDKLQEDLVAAQKQITTIEQVKKAAANEVETLRREIMSALNDRDKAMKDCHDLREKLANLEMDVQRNADSEKYAEDMNNLKAEVETLKSNVVKAEREAEILESRRNWAFSERDKIVLERESMKILCDNLRRERDKALADLAEVRRDLDEMHKLRSQAVNEAAELRDRVEQRSYRDVRVKQLHNKRHNESRDSAIDADFAVDMLTETLEVDLSAEPSKLGFDLSGGIDDPNYRRALYVSHVAKGSAAEGKLQVSDHVLRVNNVDLMNADRQTALQILHASNGTLSLLIRRRRTVKPTPKFISLNCHVAPASELGLTTAKGLFITRLSSSSPLRDMGLCVGDRITQVAGENVDEKSPEQLQSLLEVFQNHVVRMNIIRYFATSPSLSTSPSALMQCSSDVSESDKNSNRISSIATNSESPIHQPVSTSSVAVQTEQDLIRNDSTLRQKKPSDWRSLFESKEKARPRLDNVFPGIDIKSGSTVVKTTRVSSAKIPKAQNFFDKLLGRERKPRPTIELVPNAIEERSAIEQLESVVEHYQSSHGSRSTTKKRIENYSDKFPGGTWPKIKGSSPENLEKMAIDKSSPKELSRKSTNSLTLHSRTPAWVVTDINIDDDATVPSTPFNRHCQTNRSTSQSHRLSMPPIYDTRIFSPPLPQETAPRQLLTSYPESIDVDSASVSSSVDFPPTPKFDSRNFAMDSVSGSGMYQRSVPAQYPGIPTSRVFSPVINNSIYKSIDSRASSAMHPMSPLPHVPMDRLPMYATVDPLLMRRPVSLGIPTRQQPWMEPDYASPRSQRMVFPPGFSNPNGSSKSSLSYASNEADCHSPILDGHSLKKNPTPLYQTVRKRPELGLKRTVRLDWYNREYSGFNKEYPYPGFKIVELEKEILCRPVVENSAADRAGLVAGDQLIEVEGINFRSVQYHDAVKVLKNAFDSSNVRVSPVITMQVAYRGPFQSLGNSTGSFVQSPISSSSTVNTDSMRGPTGTLKATLRPSIESVKEQSPDSVSGMHEARFVKLNKGLTESLGVNLIGGNVHGIFIHSVKPGSVATGPNGLGCGEQILEYNGVNMRNLLLEKAMNELCKPVQTVSIVVQYNPVKYELAKSTAGDTLYVRALWDRDKSQLQDEDLMFHRGDILLIDNTLYNGEIGSWRAWRIGGNAEKTGDCGIIPNRYNAEEEVQRLHQSVTDVVDSLDPHRRSARRSFFKRRKIHRQPGRELASFSSSSLGTDNFSVAPEEPIIPTYQKVEKLVYEEMRPVIIYGPLSDVIMDRLATSFPHKFCRCPVMRAPPETASLEESDVVEVRQCMESWETVTVDCVRRVMGEERHCLMDISVTSLERLRGHEIQPIILLTKFRSPASILGVRDENSEPVGARLSSKAAKELYELGARMESENGKMISAIIPGDAATLSYMISLVLKAVEEAQTTPQWIPVGPVL